MVELRKREVWSLAEELLGPVHDVVHQPYGHAGLTFAVHAAAGDFTLKTSDKVGAFKDTERHIDTLSALDISTPRVTGHGHWRGFDYLLLSRIAGVDLGHALGEMTEPEMEALAIEIVLIERKVTSLPMGAGFGWTSMGEPGPFASWTALIERDARTLPEALRGMLTTWRPYFDEVAPLCFLDDLTVKNVIVEGGRFQGIVDLDQICYGDPLYWLSLAEVTSILDVGPRAAFYGECLRRQWGMTPATSAACDVYNVIQAWFFLSKDADHPFLAAWATERFERAGRYRP